MESIGISLSYLLDLIIGDPYWFPHPVKEMGRFIIFLEKRLRNGKEGYVLRVKGILLAIIVVEVSVVAAYMLLYFAGRINYILKIVFWVILGYMSLATKDLFLHVKRILESIKSEDMEGARKNPSFIVGRDAQDLSKEEIITACIESIAENTNDGIIAPLFYLILGGPVLAIGYKAINTLDSMVGYRNQHYKDFGWFSARLDDFANFILARITGMLIVISSFLLRYVPFTKFENWLYYCISEYPILSFTLLCQNPYQMRVSKVNFSIILAYFNPSAIGITVSLESFSEDLHYSKILCSKRSNLKAGGIECRIGYLKK